MVIITKEEIVERIRQKTGMSKGEIEHKIREIAQVNEISEHAAALLLAEELGVKTDEEGVPLMHISELVPGMRGINIVGRVLRKYPVRDYKKKDGSQGRVAGLLIYDNTGRARVVLWDSEISKYYNEIQVGRVIKIINADVRESLRGLPELHVNFRSRLIINPDDPRVEEIPPIEEVRSYNYTRKSIGELMDGEKFVEIRGTIAKLYRIIAYDACPQCRRKVDYDSATDTWICIEHGEVKPITATILDFGLDDSTGYIRVTLFGDDVVEILGVEPEEISEKLKELIKMGMTAREAGRKLAEDEFYHVLGKEILVRGNVVEDRFLGLILKASSWDEVDCKREIERVRRELLREVE